MNELIYKKTVRNIFLNFFLFHIEARFIYFKCIQIFNRSPRYLFKYTVEIHILKKKINNSTYKMSASDVSYMQTKHFR